MAINFYNSPESSQWVSDATNTATLPVTGELFTAGHVDRIADEVSAIQYALGVPGLRGTAGPVWGTNVTITTGLATSSVTSVVFASNISAVLTSGMLIAGAAPTTTGWRRITAVATFTVTVNAAFDSNLASEYAVQHGNVSRRIAAIEAVSNRLPMNYITGLTLSNNGSDPTNDIDIAAGSARDSTDAVNIDLSTSYTKRLDAAWAVGSGNGGLDTGAIANTTYHIWLIKRSDTGVVDVLFSASATAPTMPANYGYKRRIGSIRRVSAALQTFVQDGDLFQLKVPVADVAATNPGTSAVTRALSTPSGVRVQALLRAAVTNSSTGAAPRTVITDLSVTDAAPDPTATPGADIALVYNGAGASNEVASRLAVFTDTSAQVRSRLSASDAAVTLYIITYGWIDTRGA
jgi:hypothetical protein